MDASGQAPADGACPAAAPLVVLDTNVFVAAGFNSGSASGRIVSLAADGRLRLAWNADTRAETRHVLRQIPRLDPTIAERLFEDGCAFESGAPPAVFAVVPDPSDRKFAALAQIAGATLISSDSDLLSVRQSLPVTVLTPKEWLAAHMAAIPSGQADF
ncbi:putative toxin-antitoxin system toxin component, PIN family [Marinibaculum pumilum]|uniref:Toxin-antitoxin system toxin component, PIN family n=1 Tax=Marinibaculum pumilum TaxID=1766165 RepID=A0ABV7L411_9PROT